MQTYPDHGIVGEEYGAERADAEFVWVLDPIDGTRSFITGLPMWGILIGLLHAGRPILGMMAQPFTGERFAGDSPPCLVCRAARPRPARLPSVSGDIRGRPLHHHAGALPGRRPRRL